MSSEAIGGAGIAALLALILMRVPVAVAMGLVGFLGYVAIEGWQRATLVLGALPNELMTGYALSVVPLFVLMGEFANASGLSRDLYRSANALFRSRRGSLLLATIGACAGFGAVSGSSLATAATIGRVAVPQMREAGYDARLVAGTVAAGGTLGILIPPSVILLIYAAVARQSVPELFAAAVVPGLVLTFLYVGVVVAILGFRPNLAPRVVVARESPVRELAALWETAFLFGVSVGGIYLGWFSPTEAAAVGAFLALAVGALRHRLDRWRIASAFRAATQTTGMLFFIILATSMFTFFIVQSRLPAAFADWMQGMHLGVAGVVTVLTLFYIVMGCFIDGLGIILITTPLFAPLVLASGFDMVWFGIYLVVIVELGLVTPPVGMNLYVIAEQMPGTNMHAIFRGVLPFVAAQLVLVVLLVLFPQMVAWLPKLLY